MNRWRVFPVWIIYGRTIYILSASKFYQQLLSQIQLHLSVFQLFGYVGVFILAFGNRNQYETDLARFQRTLADGRIGCFIRLGLGFNPLVVMATSYTQKYRYGGLVVDVIRLSEQPNGKARFQCVVRGFGQGNPAPRERYEVEAESNAQASRVALQKYRNLYG